ncbi:adenylate/guanylate cyclase domain-containing protein [Thalassococcus sp. S3]|uniref:adenylate/guanylate cyclase domain-containing protein n=1 Tax=Thalassococcus sp. S3 TaxID=2017482 RepID=UPI001024749C|nr:adenylate/guanylate cyclase domain-containing protein [Thalassococcus sp. S3]QBF33819.1 guanylate cyclase [Thalassococcus sp. S3]
MADTSGSLPTFTAEDLPERMTEADLVEQNKYTRDALERHKREGLELATKARWVALSVIAVLLPFLNPSWEMLYYHILLALMAINGWFLRRVGRVGRSSAELFCIFVDIALMTFALVFPNPFMVNDWPDPMVYRFENFLYFFVILTGGTLAFSWKTIMALGHWTVTMWLIAALLMWWLGATDPELSGALSLALTGQEAMAKLLDPNAMNFDIRAQEIVVFLICTYTLALCVRRFNRLLLSNASLERERANLSRYFSPNVVEELSRNDEPLKAIRNHNVAVLFVDIVGFTHLAADRHPQEVIKTLRRFHGRMEAEVFAHDGTLDKYLGDGLMATFGTPMAGEKDATNALSCAKAMIQAVSQYNYERVRGGEPPIKASIGVHYGPVVLGDIGANRLEYAVIGNTVNVANRLEKLTRDLEVQIVVSDHLRGQVIKESGEDSPALAGLTRHGGQAIRGLDKALAVWTV